uniref:Translin n=7 Tax=Neoaves TaxID=3078114 RepID=A0A8C5JUJ8_JUNHY
MPHEYHAGRQLLLRAQRPRQPGPGLAGPGPPPRRAAPLTLAVRLVRARCTFCWNWRCSRGSSARSGAALTAAADAGTSAAMASPAAMLPPRGRRKCVTAPAPPPRGQTPSPGNGADGPSRGHTGPGPAAPGGRPGTRTPPGRQTPALGAASCTPGAISTLWAPSQLPSSPLLAAQAAQAVLRAARRGAAGGAGQARAGGAEGPVGGKRRHHVGERDVRGAAGSARPGPGHPRVPKKCQKAREHFGTVRTQMESLKTKFPADQYYRFHEHWRFVLQRLVFLAAFVVYLESETLVTREAVAEILGIEADRERGFHLDIEDYLSGVLTLASELARLAVNSVTAGDYSRPLRISTFINELDSGFRLLNLKNDSLRKRYDGLKYDVKKIEEVVYDLSIRGLNKEATVGAGGEK